MGEFLSDLSITQTIKKVSVVPFYVAHKISLDAFGTFRCSVHPALDRGLYYYRCLPLVYHFGFLSVTRQQNSSYFSRSFHFMLPDRFFLDALGGCQWST